MIHEKPLFADLHIHSKYSRATSTNLSLENLEKYAKIKGIGLLGTGDFQHPKWFEELAKLKEENGILYSHTGFRFVWQTEISLVYTHQGKGRRIHFIILAPNRAIVMEIIKFFKTKGRIDYDGRPIFGFSAVELLNSMQKISDKIEIIPAHVWTPWFGIFGSMSGFDFLKDAFGNQEKLIHAIETGMSSNPAMNWRIEELKNKTIVSFSDSHSFWPWRLGREATIFSEIKSYDDLLIQIRENKILGTVETSPLYGKYHWDGHRNCKYSCSPEETNKLKGICPVCNTPLTIGVENRVEKLASHPKGYKHDKSKPSYEVLPLHELISLAYSTTINSKKSWDVYNLLIDKFDNEFNVLLNISEDELKKSLPEHNLLIELIIKNRNGNIEVIPGYDGNYGVAVIGNSNTNKNSPNLKKSKEHQTKLF